jgi:hypothetical protein
MLCTCLRYWSRPATLTQSQVVCRRSRHRHLCFKHRCGCDRHPGVNVNGNLWATLLHSLLLILPLANTPLTASSNKLLAQLYQLTNRLEPYQLCLQNIAVPFPKPSLCFNTPTTRSSERSLLTSFIKTLSMTQRTRSVWMAP